MTIFSAGAISQSHIVAVPLLDARSGVEQRVQPNNHGAIASARIPADSTDGVTESTGGHAGAHSDDLRAGTDPIGIACKRMRRGLPERSASEAATPVATADALPMAWEPPVAPEASEDIEAEAQPEVKTSVEAEAGAEAEAESGGKPPSANAGGDASHHPAAAAAAPEAPPPAPVADGASALAPGEGTPSIEAGSSLPVAGMPLSNGGVVDAAAGAPPDDAGMATHGTVISFALSTGAVSFTLPPVKFRDARLQPMAPPLHARFRFAAGETMSMRAAAAATDVPHQRARLSLAPALPPDLAPSRRPACKPTSGLTAAGISEQASAQVDEQASASASRQAPLQQHRLMLVGDSPRYASPRVFIPCRGVLTRPPPSLSRQSAAVGSTNMSGSPLASASNRYRASNPLALDTPWRPASLVAVPSVKRPIASGSAQIAPSLSGPHNERPPDRAPQGSGDRPTSDADPLRFRPRAASTAGGLSASSALLWRFSDQQVASTYPAQAAAGGPPPSARAASAAASTTAGAGVETYQKESVSARQNASKIRSGMALPAQFRPSAQPFLAVPGDLH